MGILESIKNIQSQAKEFQKIDKRYRAEIERVSPYVKEIDGRYAELYDLAKAKYNKEIEDINEKREQEIAGVKVNVKSLKEDKYEKENEIEELKEKFLGDYKLDNKTMCSILSHQTGLNWQTKLIAGIAYCSMSGDIPLHRYGFVLLNENSSYYDNDPQNKLYVSYPSAIDEDPNIIVGISGARNIPLEEKDYIGMQKNNFDKYNWMQKYLNENVKLYEEYENEQSEVSLYKQELIKNATEAYIKDPTLSFINENKLASEIEESRSFDCEQ